MLSRVLNVAMRLMRATASAPLRMLGEAQRGMALEQLSSRMVSTVDLSEGAVRFVTPTPLLLARAHSLLTKEPDTIKWIDGFQQDDIFWDVGANVGVFSLYAVRRRGVGRVLAFEPSADNYAILCKNVEMNAFEDRIVPYCLALAGTTELGVLNSPTREKGASLHQFGAKGDVSRYSDGRMNSCAQGMVGFTIDDFIRQFSPPFPTRLKLDVDGLEWPILQGAGQTLRDARLRFVMAELPVSNQEERDCAIALLADAGFTLVQCGATQESGGESAANHFFEKQRR
jgi:FkbM family methyltransferase